VLAVAVEGDAAAAERVVEIFAEAKDPELDLLEAYFWKHLEAIEPTARPFIARLSVGYFIHRRGPDVFFRRVGRMLVDATTEEVEELRVMFSLARHVIGSGSFERAIIVQTSELDKSVTYVHVERNVEDTDANHRREVVGVKRAMEALRRNLVVAGSWSRLQVAFDDEEDRGDASRETLMRLIRVFA
jgi:hypothetical protein